MYQALRIQLETNKCPRIRYRTGRISGSNADKLVQFIGYRDKLLTKPTGSYCPILHVYCLLRGVFRCLRVGPLCHSGGVSLTFARPGGTGPVGPAMAGPTFGLGRISFTKIQNKTVKFLESKVYTKKRRPLLTGK